MFLSVFNPIAYAKLAILLLSFFPAALRVVKNLDSNAGIDEYLMHTDYQISTYNIVTRVKIASCLGQICMQHSWIST